MKQRLTTSLSIALLIFASFLVVKMVLGPSEAPTPEAFAATVSLENALTTASQDGRIVFAVATASWCAPCQAYKRGALADESVKSWLDDNAIAVMIDVDKDKAESARLQVRSMPTTYVIKDGEVVDRISGGVSTAELLSKLEPYTLASAD